MGNLLSDNSKAKQRAKVTETDKAILDIRIARKKLVDARKKQEVQSERAFEAVQALVKADKKERAKVALRTKKLHDRQVETLSANVLKLDEQLVALETAINQAEVLAVLRSANGAMKAVQAQMPLEHVEKLLEDNAEGAAYVAEVNQLLAADPSALSASEVDEELDELEAQVPEAEGQGEKGDNLNLPDAPTHDATTHDAIRASDAGEGHVDDAAEAAVLEAA